MSYNLVKTIPFTLRELRSLAILNVEGNPLKETPPALSIMYWTFVIGCPIPNSSLAASPFSLRWQEEHEYEGIIRHRAAERKKRASKKKIKPLVV